jgi:hypothetical protein
MSQRSVMGTGRSEFWSSSDSSTMIGTVYRNDIPAPSVGASAGGGGVMSAFMNQVSSSGVNSNIGGGGNGYRREFGRGGGLGLDLKEGWDERMVIPPLSPLPPIASLERVDGMRFEMIGDTSFAMNEKPLGGRGPLGENPQNF